VFRDQLLNLLGTGDVVLIMYEEFYGFRDNPFRLTPDPDYLFLSTNHQEALGHLLFGVREGSGVVVITGEIGAGKTTLLRTLVRNLDSSTIVAYIFNPVLSAIELLQTINADLGLPATSTSKKDLIDHLNHFLLEQQTAGRRVVVIVDEAQDLEPAVLEQLRLLSNLETEREKLVQIILVGQPELREILTRPDLAQLDQRVTLRWHLGPLNEAETAEYVRHRIRVAADGKEPVHFTAKALASVYRLARGIPRLINILCHRALLIGYTREERQIDSPTILQAAKELGRTEPASVRVFSRMLTSPLLVGMLIFLGTAMLVLASTHGWLPTQSPLNQEPARARRTAEGDTDLASQLVAATSDTTSLNSSVSASESPQEAKAAAVAPPVTSSPPVSSGAQSASLAASASPPPTPAVSTTALAVPAQEPGAEQTFLQLLQHMTIVDSAVRATNGLLQAWGAETLRHEEWRDGVIDLGAITRARRLEYLPLNGSFSLLSLLDLPAILELTTPAQNEPRFALLTSVRDGHCRLLLDHEREVPLQTLTEHWFGKAYLFWKDFENVGAPLAVGSVGQQVRRLYLLLSQAPGMNTRLTAIPRPDTYSRQTEEIVAQFQKSKRLTPDGVVGPQTMITLYNAVSRYPRPSLSMVSSPSRADRLDGSQAAVQASRTPQGN